VVKVEAEGPKQLWSISHFGIPMDDLGKIEARTGENWAARMEVRVRAGLAVDSY
jgi:hypothetical protein